MSVLTSVWPVCAQIHVTTYHLCFLGAANKKLTIPYADIASVSKAKTRFKLFGGGGTGLVISLNDGRTINLSSCMNRDEAMQGIKQAGMAQGVTVA